MGHDDAPALGAWPALDDLVARTQDVRTQIAALQAHEADLLVGVV